MGRCDVPYYAERPLIANKTAQIGPMLLRVKTMQPSRGVRLCKIEDFGEYNVMIELS